MADRNALTASELDEFKQQGVLVLRDRVPDATLRSLEAAFGRAIDRIAEQRGVAAELPDGDYDTRYRALRRLDPKPIIGAWRRVLVTPEVYALWQVPQLLGPVRSILGDDVLAHGIWNGRPREPHASTQRVSWHQDAHYYRGWDPADGGLLSMWLPLVPVDAMTSCLEFIPGSHRRGRLERRRDANYGFTVAEAEYDGAETLVAEMRPGDLVVFSDTMLHQSTENTSDRIRWSIDIRFAEATPALAAKNPRGYRLDPVEPYDVWAARYDYENAELADELENFADLDPERVRASLQKDPEPSIY